MNFKTLQAFRLVVSQGSLAAAAQAMNLSQPAVSRLIQMLEGETRLKLFDRTRRSLTLSEAGDRFYRETRHILDGIDELPHIAAGIQAGQGQPLRLVTAPRTAAGLVTPALARLQRSQPNLKSVVDVLSRFEFESRSGIARYDLGIGSLPVPPTLMPIESRPLCRVRMEAVMAADHPLARKDAVTAEDLARLPIIGMQPNLFGRQQTDAFFRSSGLMPAYAVETTSSVIACQLARDGAGIAINDRLSVLGAPAGIVTRPMAPAHWLLFGYIFHAGQILSEDAQTFLDCVRSHIDDFRAESAENADCVVPQGADT
ncbi:MAG: LysR family transcriptional regulator [Rhodospirillaceae bacterium]|nr:LysR family transcriptional regulator [Rhodospirillaceae bacterium]